MYLFRAAMGILSSQLGAFKLTRLSQYVLQLLMTPEFRFHT